MQNFNIFNFSLLAVIKIILILKRLPIMISICLYVMSTFPQIMTRIFLLVCLLSTFNCILQIETYILPSRVQNRVKNNRRKKLTLMIIVNLNLEGFLKSYKKSLFSGFVKNKLVRTRLTANRPFSSVASRAQTCTEKRRACQGALLTWGGSSAPASWPLSPSFPGQEPGAPGWQDAKEETVIWAAATIFPGTFFRVTPPRSGSEVAFTRASRGTTSLSFLLGHPAAAGSAGHRGLRPALSRQSGWRGEGAGAPSISCLLHAPPPGNEPTTQTWALIGNRNGDLLVPVPEAPSLLAYAVSDIFILKTLLVVDWEFKFNWAVCNVSTSGNPILSKGVSGFDLDFNRIPRLLVETGLWGKGEGREELLQRLMVREVRVTSIRVTAAQVVTGWQVMDLLWRKGCVQAL